MNTQNGFIRIGFSHMNFFNSLYPWQRRWTIRQRLDRAITDMKEIGANAWRPWVHWCIVEPVIAQPLLRMQDVTDEMVEQYARGEGRFWSDYDYLVQACSEAGIELHLVVGGGYHFHLPYFEHMTSGMKFLPSVVGPEHYLAHLFLHVRAVVRRYREKVSLWQIENELNGAGETRTFVKWRHGKMWWDWSFLTAIMETLYRAVKMEDEKALVSHNFITDFRRLPGLLDWKEDIRRWKSFVDIIGVDSYPDYVLGYWSRGAEVAKKVATAKELIRDKPVMVLEAGYPTAPSYRGFSEQGQVRYIETAVEASIKAGAEGYYYYNLVSPEGQMRWFQGETLFEKIEPYWGLIRSDGTKKPGFEAFKKACKRVIVSG